MKAICVDGPLKGKLFDMGMSPSPFAAADTAASVVGQWSDDISHYRPQKFGFTSGGYTVLLWVAYSGPEPGADVLADILVLSGLPALPCSGPLCPVETAKPGTQRAPGSPSSPQSSSSSGSGLFQVPRITEFANLAACSFRTSSCGLLLSLVFPEMLPNSAILASTLDSESNNPIVTCIPTDALDVSQI